MTRNDELPSYRQLPVRPDGPPGSSWGLWGEDDQLGTLNLLTDERTQRAAALVRRGRCYPSTCRCTNHNRISHGGRRQPITSSTSATRRAASSRAAPTTPRPG